MREANGLLAVGLAFGIKSRSLSGVAASIGLYWIRWLCAIIVESNRCGEAYIVSVGLRHGIDA